MTKISFSNLDKLRLRPTGVYGSKSEIAELLRSLGTVDDKQFVLMSVTADQNLIDTITQS